MHSDSMFDELILWKVGLVHETTLDLLLTVIQQFQ